MRYRDRFAPKAEDDRYNYHYDCLQGESNARLGAFIKQPRRMARPFFVVGDTMAARSDSETSRHYLAGLPQTAVTGVWRKAKSTQEVLNNRDFLQW